MNITFIFATLFLLVGCKTAANRSELQNTPVNCQCKQKAILPDKMPKIVLQEAKEKGKTTSADQSETTFQTEAIAKVMDDQNKETLSKINTLSAEANRILFSDAPFVGGVAVITQKGRLERAKLLNKELIWIQQELVRLYKVFQEEGGDDSKLEVFNEHQVAIESANLKSKEFLDLVKAMYGASNKITKAFAGVSIVVVSSPVLLAAASGKTIVFLIGAGVAAGSSGCSATVTIGGGGPRDDGSLNNPASDNGNHLH